MSNKDRLYVGVFLTGFSVMVLELLGTRLVAPYIGSSLHVWTSLIGVVLGFLSLGYYFGGIKSEKNASYENLAKLVVWAALWVFVIAMGKEIFLQYLVKVMSSRYGQSFVASVILFGIPSFLLGAVSPYAARLLITNVKDSGASVGRLYAISTVGSIVGTFMTGFWLVLWLGHLRSLYLVFIVLVAASLIISKSQLVLKIGLILAGLLALMQGWGIPGRQMAAIVLDRDTPYFRVQIKEGKNNLGTLRGMFTDGAYSSGVMMNDPKILAFPYYNYYDLMFWNNQDLNKVLMVGGAGMGYPRYVLASYPEIELTVVEIDPELYQIAQTVMGFEPTDKLKMVFEDGRIFLNDNRDKYDAVLFDVFSATTIPAHLLTKEAAIRVKQGLVEDGLVVMNIISALEGDQGQIIRAAVATFKEVFDEVEVFAVGETADKKQIQNLVLVAANKELDFEQNSLPIQARALLASRKSVSLGHRILTDDWSPTEAYTAKMLVSR